MRLLVSTANAADALEALAGGADLIDAKDPATGALGAVRLGTLREIQAVVGAARPLTAALGEARDEGEIEKMAQAFAGAGATLVKVGFAGITSEARVGTLLAAAVRGAVAGHPHGGVIAVAYADGTPADVVRPIALVAAAARAGAAGVLLDTADKCGPGVLGLVTSAALASWVRHAHEAGLLAAIAGKLSTGDLPRVRETGADIAGVRGAACDSGRTGRVAVSRVRALRAICASAPTATVGTRAT